MAWIGVVDGWLGVDRQGNRHLPSDVRLHAVSIYLLSIGQHSLQPRQRIRVLIRRRDQLGLLADMCTDIIDMCTDIYTDMCTVTAQQSTGESVSRRVVLAVPNILV